MTDSTYRHYRAVLAITTFIALISPVHAQESFFKGKTLHIIVGGPPGGGFRYLCAHDSSGDAQIYSRHADNHRR